MTRAVLLSLAALLAAAGCAEEVKTRPGVLLIILDDVGAASLGAYADHWARQSYNGTNFKPSRTAPTPHMANICGRGVRFLDAWSYPTCSPTRANILTGRHSFRTGVGEPCGKGTNSIGLDEPTLTSLLKIHKPAVGRGSVGKWHLGTTSALGGASAPNTMGWQYFAGILSGASDYFSWERTVNGTTATSTTYATTQLTDDAIAYIASLEQEQPYLMWLAYNAPHTPLHLPPSGLHSYSALSATVDASKSIDYFEAMLEATDTEIGRLLASLPDEDGDGLPDDTLVILMGDNGTLNGNKTKLLPSPFDGAKGKGSIYEHGVRVPLCIAGRGVASGGRDEDALVHVTDLYGTILEALGVDLATALPTSSFSFDSVSLTPYLKQQKHDAERAWIMTEQFKAASSSATFDQGIAVKSASYKFMRWVKGGNSLDKYKDRCFSRANLLDDLNGDLYGGTDKTAIAACDALKTAALDLVCKESKNPWSSWCP